MRIVSLISSSTELLCALGLEGNLVGRSHECDFPKSILGLPVCTEIKFAADGTSYEIDQRVKAILQEGLSVYRVKADLLKKLNPDVILTQIQCEVCAVSEKDVLLALEKWVDGKPRVISLKPNAMADFWRDLKHVALQLGVPERGERLEAQWKGRMGAIKRIADRLKTRPSIACVEWVAPLMAAGNWVPELVELAGGTNLFGEAGRHSPYMTWQQLRDRDPEVVVVMPCGFDIERSRQDLPLLEAMDGWRDLRAVRAGRVFVADGNQYFNRPGPRLVESLEILAEILHPSTFDFGHRDRGYVPVMKGAR